MLRIELDNVVVKFACPDTREERTFVANEFTVRDNSVFFVLNETQWKFLQDIFRGKDPFVAS